MRLPERVGAPVEYTPVAPSEWRWVLIASLIILISFTVPYAVGGLSSTPNEHFSGFVTGLEDVNSYLAKMRYGARDGWVLQNVYTSEPHDGGVVYLPLLALGKLVAAISGEGANVSTTSLIWAYHVARVLCGLVLLVVTYRFVAQFLSNISHRRAAWLLASLAGGLGWVTLVLNPSVTSFQALPIELYVPEAFTTLLLFSHPHLALARSLMLGGWLLMLSSTRLRDRRLPWLAGAAWLGMGLCVPFYIALLGILICGWLTATAISTKSFPAADFSRALVAGILPLTYLLYNASLFTTNPVFATWAAQNILPSPPIVNYAFAFAIPVILASGAVPTLLRRGWDQSTRLLVIWPLTAAVLTYAPIGIQRRLIEGSIVPLSILAVMGFDRITASQSKTLRLAATSTIAVLLLPSTAVLVAGGVLTAGVKSWPVYHGSMELAAYDWLNANADPDSIVLSTRESGMVIPAYTHTRVFVGHGPETINYLAKEQLVAELLASKDAATRDKFFDQNHIDYVWVGPPETGQCGEPECKSLFAVPGFRLVFQRGEYSIYRVVR